MSSFFFKADGFYYRIKVNETIYIEGSKNYVIIHTKSKKRMLHCTLKQVEEQLPAELFFRIHKSYIIVLEQLDSFNREHLRLEDCTELPVSKQYYEALKDRLKIINGEKKTKAINGIAVNGSVIIKKKEC